jgi:hypothetical protein
MLIAHGLAKLVALPEHPQLKHLGNQTIGMASDDAAG